MGRLKIQVLPTSSVPWLAVLAAVVFSLLLYCQVSAGPQGAIDWRADMQAV